MHSMTKSRKKRKEVADANDRPTKNQKAKGLTIATLKELLIGFKKQLRDEGRDVEAGEIGVTGNHVELAKRCFDLNLITPEQRDGKIPRKRTFMNVDERIENTTIPCDGSPAITCVVDCLKNVAKEDTEATKCMNAIKDAVNRMHLLSLRATQLVRLFALMYPDFNAMLDVELYVAAFDVVSAEGAVLNGKNALDDEKRRLLSKIWSVVSADTSFIPVSLLKLNQVIRFESEKLFESACVNIKTNFVKHMKTLVNVTFEVKTRLKATQTKSEKRDLNKIFNTVKSDLGNGVLESTDPSFIEFIHYWRSLLPPGPYAKDSISYDVHVRPMAYFKVLVYISRVMELNGIRQFQVLPLRTNMTPCHITIDTCAFCQITSTPRPSPLTYQAKLNVWFRFLLLTDVKKSEQPQINNLKRLFRKGKKDKPTYVFRGMLMTDGVSVSVLLVRSDLLDKKGLDRDWKRVEKMHDDVVNDSLRYVNAVELDVLKREFAGRDVVVNDPGKRDLLYSRSLFSNQKIRYTKSQRNLECNKKKYEEKRNDLNNKAGELGGRTIQQWNDLLSELNCKTTSTTKFIHWMRLKLSYVDHTRQHYQQDLFRRLKFNAKINRRRSEDLFVQRFKETFGGPDKAVVVMGDWSNGTGNLKHSPPTPRRGLIRMFQRHQYQVWLLNEFRTSKSCSKCHNGDCTTFLEWTCNITNKNGKVHNLIQCDSCGTIHNRNANATANMIRIMNSILDGKERPADLAH